MRNSGNIPALSYWAYTTTLLVMVEGGGGVYPTTSPGWADFTIMMECTQVSGHCHSMYSIGVIYSTRWGTGGFFLKTSAPLFNDDLSNEPIFGHLAGQYL